VVANIYSSQGNNSLVIDSTIQLDYASLKKALKKFIPSFQGSLSYRYSVDYAPTMNIYFPTCITNGHVPDRKMCCGFREWLTNTELLPICKGSKYNQVKWPIS